MKSFTLHLVIIFTVGVINQQFGTFCTAISTAHDRHNTSSTSNFQTSKTPRTIQRLVGGHLQQHNIENKRFDKTTNTTSQLSRVYFRRKPNQIRGTYHSSGRNSTILKRIEPTSYDDDDYSDAAFLEDTKELDNWDNGIFRSSAGAGKEDTSTKAKKKEDGKKTLSDQVAEGKYGLIEKELFQNTPKRPGVISYSSNKEVPSDTSKNYGGLNEEDIWLAEDHLLVLKGGALNSQDLNEPWKPIDDYQAPSRQIKIPANPKVPPPFPVQFEDNGPIQFIGDHKFPFFYPFENDSLPLFPENGYLPPETNGYDEKNILTRPGSFKNSTKSKGGYFYPPAFPPWLFNNETVVNPYLNFPGASPQFPFAFNGSLDNINDPDDIDEDDPSLYYPPPYSFVYKSNYTSPVPPGPLVPGIVLPPPPNAFARLEEPSSRKTPVKDVPFRQILTKISEYKPKQTTTIPPPPITTTKTSTTSTTTEILPPIIVAPVQRQKEIYYINKRPQVHERGRPYLSNKQIPPTTTVPPPPIPPEIISFVPKSPSSSNTVGQGNPIYYEYFDARKETPGQNIYNEYPTIVTAPPPPVLPPRTHNAPVTTTRPAFKQVVTHLRPQNTPQVQRLNKSYLPARPYDEYLYIAPNPEIKPNGISNNYLPLHVDQPYKAKPNFDREVDAIRQTLQFYKAQQLKQNQIPRAPKGKAVYEYSFDATGTPSKAFNPPSQYDEEPFKPMVQYSRPVSDANGFKAISYAKSDETTSSQPIYYTTQIPPVQDTAQVRVSAKSYNQQIVYNTTPQPNEYPAQYQQQIYDPPQQPIQYSTSKTPIGNSRRQPPWFTIEKQVLEEVPPRRPQSQNQNHRASAGYSRKINGGQRQGSGYYYERPLVNRRQNNRYIQYTPEIPFNQHLGTIRAQLNQYQQQPQAPFSLENDTYVNFKPPLRGINPDAEFVQVQRRQQYQQYPQSQQQRLPIVPHPSHQAQYQPISLNRDILVNYRLPLPPINPDSEFIQPQAVSRQQLQQQPHPQQQYRYPNDQSNVYYITPRDARYKKSN